MGIQKDFIQRLRGRAEFCRDRGEVKTPELLEHAAQLLEEKAQTVPEGFVLVEREKLAMIFETATNALVYHAAPPKHDALSIIQGIARKAMLEAQEQNQ